MERLMSLEAIYEAVLKGNAAAAAEHTKNALDAGITAHSILNNACMPAMAEVGRLFEIGEKFVPEMLIAARAMQSSINILRPLLVKAGVKTIGKVVIGTVQGDLHDIGKNLVAMMLEGAGFEIIDLGTDVAPATFVQAVQENHPDILGMSALLTTTMPAINATIEALKTAGIRDHVKVVIGGAPVNQRYAERVGADGFAPDAGSATHVVRTVLGLSA
jgi:5-methyltetrahydrofolate--homocysteine methyltransferase